MHIATLDIHSDTILFVNGERVASFYDDTAHAEGVFLGNNGENHVDFNGFDRIKDEDGEVNEDWQEDDIINALNEVERKTLGIK